MDAWSIRQFKLAPIHWNPYKLFYVCFWLIYTDLNNDDIIMKVMWNNNMNKSLDAQDVLHVLS